jgi:hypothetical protein
MPTVDEVIGAANLLEQDIDRISRRLYDIKARAYRDTLRKLSVRHGVPRGRVILSAEIREAIQLEADQHARAAVETFNRMVTRFADRRRGLPPDQLAAQLRGYLRKRAKSRSRVVAQLAPLNARLDAEVSFYREQGVEPEFDFIGPRAKCPLCRKLKRGGPYAIEDVIRIGLPHLGCVHHWRSRSRAKEQLTEGGLRPGQISAGRGTPAGILGSTALLSRVGGHGNALDVVDGVVMGVA